MSVSSIGSPHPSRAMLTSPWREKFSFSTRVRWGLLTFAPIAVFFVGYALRVWRLSAFSLTPDEFDSILFATMPVNQLFNALATYEPHPPFYYLFLHAWLNLIGQSELAVRFPSVLFGTIAVAGAYSSGRAIGGRPAGLAAATILAASQFSVLYSQDARMYAALQAWIALYLAGLLRYLQRPTRLSAGVVVVAGLLAAYTHYHGLLVVGLSIVPVLLTVSPREVLIRLRPFVLILVLYAPWVYFARQIFLIYRGWMAPVSPLEILHRSAVAYSVGVGVNGPGHTAALVVIPAFAIAGLVALASGRRWQSLLVLAGLGLVPLVAVILGTMTGRPLYDERYLIVVTPAYLTLAGVGVAFICRATLVRPIALAAFVALGAVSLPAYYLPATLTNPDYRSTVAYIEKAAGPGAIVVLPHPQEHGIPYYLENRLPSYTAPDHPPVDLVAADLAARVAGHSEAFFVRYATDPSDEAIARWLEAHAFYLGDQWISQNHVVTYAIGVSADLTDRPATAQLVDGVKVTTLRLEAAGIHPGERVLAGFQWSAPPAGAGAIPSDTKVSLRLTDPWNQTVAVLDRLLVNPAELRHLDSLPIWQGALTVPPDAVPGHYRLEARFYNTSSGQAIAVTDSSGPPKLALDLGAVSVEPTDASALSRLAKPDATALAIGSGLSIQKLALASGPFSQYSHLIANFVWASQTDHPESVVPELGVRATSGDIVASVRRAEPDQPYPLSQLRAGERVSEHLDLALRPVTATGTYAVVLRTGADRPWVQIGSIAVTIDPNSNPAVPMTAQRSDLFDGVIRLIGTNLPGGPVRAGSAFTVALGWHAESQPTVDYTVFVHLVKGSGQPLAQSDAPPGGPARPTTDWLSGDDVQTQLQITVPPTLPPGDYNLIAGLYQADTGRRAAAVGSSADGQTVTLGTITMRSP